MLRSLGDSNNIGTSNSVGSTGRNLSWAIDKCLKAVEGKTVEVVKKCLLEESTRKLLIW